MRVTNRWNVSKWHVGPLLGGEHSYSTHLLVQPDCSRPHRVTEWWHDGGDPSDDYCDGSYCWDAVEVEGNRCPNAMKVVLSGRVGTSKARNGIDDQAGSRLCSTFI